MSNRVRPLQWWSGSDINNFNMAVMWTFYVQVLLSYSCSCTCLGFDDLLGNGNAPAGYRWMMMDEILRRFDPKTYSILPWDVAMATGRLQGGAGGSGRTRRTSARSLPARAGSRGLPARTGSRGLATDGEETPVQQKDDDGGAPARSIDVEETGLPSTPPADDSVVQIKHVAINRQTVEKIKQQNRNNARKKKPSTYHNAITAVKIDEGDQHERRKREFFAPDSVPPPTLRQMSDGDSRNDDYDRNFHVIGGDNEDVWRQDAVVVAVVVDPGRRVRMFSRVDGDDDDGTVAAVDASMIDAESTVDTAAADDPSASPNGVLAIAAPYSPADDKLATPILPDIRSHQILPSTLNAAHATSDAVELQTATTYDNVILKVTQTPATSMGTTVPSKLVNEHNYADSSIFNTWKKFFSYNYQYFQSLSDPKDSNSLVTQQLVYEGEMYDNSLKDNYGVSEYNKFDDDDVDHKYDESDDKYIAVFDGDEGIDYNDDSSYEVDNSEQYNREVYVYNSDDNNSKVSRLNEMMQSKQLVKRLAVLV